VTHLLAFPTRGGSESPADPGQNTRAVRVRVERLEGTEGVMSTDRTALTVAESPEVLAEIDARLPYAERAFPFHLCGCSEFHNASMLIHHRPELGDRTWRGTHGEFERLADSVRRHCEHKHPRNRMHGFCYCHMEFTQREWDGLLFAGRLAPRLLAAEMAA
jgi:hypothetical protein